MWDIMVISTVMFCGEVGSMGRKGEMWALSLSLSQLRLWAAYPHLHLPPSMKALIIEICFLACAQSLIRLLLIKWECMKRLFIQSYGLTMWNCWKSSIFSSENYVLSYGSIYLCKCDILTVYPQIEDEWRQVINKGNQDIKMCSSREYLTIFHHLFDEH